MSREEFVKNEIRRCILSEKKNLTGHTVFFFGSRVAGTPKDRSDFDVGISRNPDVDIKKFFLLDARLDAVKTLYKIDLVDFSRVSEEFRNEAMKNMEVIVG